MHKIKTICRSVFHYLKEWGMYILIILWVFVECVVEWITKKEIDLSNPSQLDLDEYEYKTYHK